ncbi:RES domain-containing protein [Erythrobacter vulgaris]|uniref:RES domain-containing protein n=1 Tax=Qipengyuania vulgaris TaxID=291985 RepID=A0A844XTS3_9SPHN|nr:MULTISPECIES: RES family NAD+ phosphorylase [Erythrobacteraceae]MXO49485.1 RES domain-containing protein [Qipengyuania vulgaris]
MSGAGAASNGGRWNPPGVEMLYLSADPTTAMVESQPSLDPFKPVTLISYVLRNARVFDTRDPNTHAQYDITPDLLATNWYTHVVEQTQAPTWDLADTLAADGFHGASYASMHNDLENVALWAWNLNSEAILRVIDQDRRLPKNDKSWR